MTFEEYLEFDKLMWKGKQTKRAMLLLEKWEKLSKKQQNEYINKKYEIEANE